MNKLQVILSSAALLVCQVPARAQVLATQRAGFNLPPGQVAAPNSPGGGVVVGSNLYTGDAVNGFRHWKPADPANPDPINSGFLVFDQDPSFSVGGTALCIFFCKVGQVAYDGNQTVYVTAFDQPKGQPGSVTFPGVWRLTPIRPRPCNQWALRLTAAPCALLLLSGRTFIWAPQTASQRSGTLWLPLARGAAMECRSRMASLLQHMPD
jgi:hypothetical protein